MLREATPASSTIGTWFQLERYCMRYARPSSIEMLWRLNRQFKAMSARTNVSL
jgi:hypothetical protein